MGDFQAIVVNPITDMWRTVLGAIPVLLSVVVILLIGWFASGVIRQATVRFLKLARLDVVSEKSGISAVLLKGDITKTLSEILGDIVYWMVMLVVFLIATNALKLTVAAELLEKIVSYLPNAIAAIVVLVLGIFFASVLAVIVKTTAANSGIRQAKFLAQLTQVIVVIFTVLQSLQQLQLDVSQFEMVIQAILWSLAGGVGLAIGLGCKDIAQKYVQQLVDSFKK